MRKDTIALFVALLAIAVASFLAVSWFAKLGRAEVWAKYTSPGGIAFTVASDPDWEISQPVYCCVSDPLGPSERRSVLYGRPAEDNAKREFEFLTSQSGNSVAFVQTAPEWKVLALYDEDAAELWAFEPASRQHQKLWQEIKTANS